MGTKHASGSFESCMVQAKGGSTFSFKSRWRGTHLLRGTGLVLEQQRCEAAAADALRVRSHSGKAHARVALQARHYRVSQLLVWCI